MLIQLENPTTYLEKWFLIHLHWSCHMFCILNATKYQRAPFKLVMHTAVKLIWQTDPRPAPSAWTAIQTAKVTQFSSLTSCCLSVRSVTGYQGWKVWVFARATQSSNWNGYGNSYVCLWWLGKKMFLLDLFHRKIPFDLLWVTFSGLRGSSYWLHDTVPD